MRWTKAKAIKLSVVTLYNLLSLLGTCLITESLIGAPLRTSPTAGVAVLAALFAVYFFMMWRDLYARSYHYYLRNTYRIVIRNSLVAATTVLLIVLASSAVDHAPPLPHLSVYLAAGLISFSAMHLMEFAWIRHLSRLGYFRRNVLTVGNPDERLPLQQYFQDVGRTMRHVGSVSVSEGRWVWRPAAGTEQVVRRLAEDLKQIITREKAAQVLFLLGPGVDRGLLGEMTRYCRARSISYYLVADVASVPSPEDDGGGPEAPAAADTRTMFDYVPIVEAFSAPRDSLTSISVKRIADIAVAALLLVCSIPLWLIVAFAIKSEDRGPVLYVSRRIGKDGRPIRFYKFRTMVVDAEARKERLLPYNERGDGPLFKMRHDPRVTRVGALLRRLTSTRSPSS